MRKSVLSRIAEAGVQLQLAEQRLDAAKAELAEAEAEARAARRELEQLVTGATAPPDQDGSDQAEEPAAEAPTLTEQVKAWFEDNPDKEVRAADLIAAGFDANADTLRSTMHRLVKDGVLAQPPKGKGRGLYMLAPAGNEPEPVKHKAGFVHIGGSAA